MVQAINSQYCKNGLVQFMPYTADMQLILSRDEIILLKIGDRVIINKYVNHPSRNLFPFSDALKNDYNHFTEIFEYNKLYLNFRSSGKLCLHKNYFFKGSERALFLEESEPMNEKMIEKREISRKEIEDLFDCEKYDSMFLFDRNGLLKFARNKKENLLIGSMNRDCEEGLLLTIKEGKFCLMWFKIEKLTQDRFRLTTRPIEILEPTIDDVIQYTKNNQIEKTLEPVTLGWQLLDRVIEKRRIKNMELEEKGNFKILKRIFKKY